MKHSLTLLISSCWVISGNADAQSFKSDVMPLIESSCIHCHDGDTETQLNFENLGYDLTDPDVFRQWERIFDRVHDGEMPPEAEPRPDPEHVEVALDSLSKSLRAANRSAQQKNGRVPARRLTRLEYDYTIRDLLSIDGDFATNLPAESDSGSFDTVGTTHRISAVHVQSYLPFRTSRNEFLRRQAGAGLAA